MHGAVVTRLRCVMIAVLLLCSLAAASAVPTIVATTGGCDDINCWAAPAMGSTRFSAAQLAAAVPIQPAIVKSSSPSRLTAPTAAGGGCTSPVRLNASACRSSGLACGSMGKLFMKVDAQMTSCSASFISDKYVLTAGHCCMDRGPGVWSTNMEFYLDWEAGAPSPGFVNPFVPTNMLVHKKWHDSRDRPHDWCFLEMNATGPSHLSPKWGYDPSQLTVGAYGWPVEPPYDGESLFEATGPCKGTSARWPPGNPPVYGPCQKLGTAGMLYMSCNTMTPGCSGGPWHDPAVGVFGLNSAYIEAPAEPIVYASPYFGSDFLASCQKAGAGCT
jgi:hypothetical protein